MSKRRQRVAGLLKRYQFIDLAAAVAADPEIRERELRTYVDREDARFPTYEAFRASIASIYGVERVLDPSPPPTDAEIEAAIRRKCHPDDIDRNIEAAAALREVLTPRNFSAYDCAERSLLMGPDRRVTFRLAHYLVRDGAAVFQFPYPRRTMPTPREQLLMLSMIHDAYVRDDFEGAVVELADLSAPPTVRGVRAARTPHIVRLDPAQLVPRHVLAVEVQAVYDLLMRIADET